MVDGDSMVICMVQQVGKALNKPCKGGVQQSNKVQNFTYHTITIAIIRFILPSIIEFFTIEFNGDVNGAWTSRCSMAIDTSHISTAFAEKAQRSFVRSFRVRFLDVGGERRDVQFTNILPPKQKLRQNLTFPFYIAKCKKNSFTVFFFA